MNVVSIVQTRRFYLITGKERESMKKLFAGFLAVMMLCLTLGSAMASTNFSWSGNDTVNFHAWGSPDWSSGSNWHITWGGIRISQAVCEQLSAFMPPLENMPAQSLSTVLSPALTIPISLDMEMELRKLTSPGV